MILITLAVSVLINMSGCLYLWRLRSKLNSIKSRPDSLELQEFLLDLLNGSGLIHVKRISPTDILLRSRRDV